MNPTFRLVEVRLPDSARHWVLHADAHWGRWQRTSNTVLLMPLAERALRDPGERHLRLNPFQQQLVDGSERSPMSDTNGLPKNTALELIRTRYEEDFNRWEAETRALADVPGAIEGESLPERARRRRNALAEAGLCAPPSPPPTPDQSFAPDLIPDPGNVRGGPDDLKALIDAAVGIVDVYQRYSGKSLPAIRGTRPEVKVSCPLPSHEDRDPSASLNTQEQVWNCFLCGCGDKYHLAARLYGLDTNNDFPEVLQRMAVDFAIPNAAPRNSANSLPLPAAGATEYDQKKGGPKTKAQMHAERVEYHASELRARREAQRLIDAEELGEGGAEHVRG